MNAVAAALAFALLASPGVPDPATSDAALDATIAREMDEAGMVGVGAALIVDGKVA